MKRNDPLRYIIFLGFLFCSVEVFGQDLDSLNMTPIVSEKIDKPKRTAEIYENGKPFKFPQSCKYAGKVLFKDRPASFMKVWITGLEIHNKDIAKKAETNYSGEYNMKLPEGSYQIQVFGRVGEVAKVKMKVNCKQRDLPDIVFGN